MRGAFPALLAAGSLFAAGFLPAADEAADGFVPLFDGRSLAGWTVENSTAGNFRVQDGVLRVEGPGGWLRSTKAYADFSLRVEFRFLTPDADSGVFVRAARPAPDTFFNGWPAGAWQVQTREMATNRNTNPIWLADIYRHSVPAEGKTEFDGDAVLAATRKTGEWQEYRIDVVGSTLTVSLNGVPVTRADGIVHPSGRIGIQGEAGIVEFRTLEIRER